MVNTMKKFLSVHEVFILVALAITLIVTVTAFHECNVPKTEAVSEIDTVAVNAEKLIEEKAKKKYFAILNRIFDLSVGDSFTKDSLRTYNYGNKYYETWIDIHLQTDTECLYEIKGKYDKSKQIDWRFYIKTKYNKIISIKR